MKRKGDDEGYKRGALGKFDKGVKLNRGSFPSSVAGTDPRGCGKYTSDDSGLRTKLPEEATASPRDIYSDVCKNSLDDDPKGSRPGPIKYGIGID